MDMGLEYRSMLGVPGGFESKWMEDISANLPGMSLKKGVGNDPDTLGKRTIWVYDVKDFPFYSAEVYHQFHDGFFPGENYPSSYNNLAAQYYNAGMLQTTGCPDVV